MAETVRFLSIITVLILSRLCCGFQTYSRYKLGKLGPRRRFVAQSARRRNVLIQEDTSKLLMADRELTPPATPTTSNDLTPIPVPQDRRLGSETVVLSQAAIIGILSGAAVGFFKLSIEAVRRVSYGSFIGAQIWLLPLVPAVGGFIVGFLGLLGGRDFPPGLRGTVNDVDESSRTGKNIQDPFQSLRKTLAAIFTLGTGCSLGPEGPSVEIGMSLSKLCMGDFFSPLNGEVDLEGEELAAVRKRRIQRNRLLLSCGAAAGVSAGFNAPIAGVFFALEVVAGVFEAASQDGNNQGKDRVIPESLATSSGSISAILLASVLSALVSRNILGDHLVLELAGYQLNTPLAEMPFFLLLGVCSGVVAFLFSQLAKASKSLFDGNLGPDNFKKFMKQTPVNLKPAFGGLMCGLIGLVYPQILFFGYDTLNGLLANSSLSTALLLTLLVVKTCTTALSAGSGLVGGTFAPSLFLGAMLGASFHNIMAWIFRLFGAMGDTLVLGSTVLQLADVPAYAMVGAASVLAALFRAPLTASLLLFELTRDYGVILPLMASAGVGSLVGDIIEESLEQERVAKRRRDVDSVSWGALADKELNNGAAREETVIIDETIGKPGTLDESASDSADKQ